MPSTTPTSPSSGSGRNTPISSGSASRAPGPSSGPRLTAVGGGTGLSALLRGLKRQVPPECLRAVVTVTDDGGSSGRLRREFGVPPPGDIRSCIVALADDEDLLARLFQYRFPNGGGLAGHSFGNLFLTALTGITGDFSQAILTAEAVLSVRGRILPATVVDVKLLARGRSGRRYEGESAIGQAGEALETLLLDPPAPPPFPGAVEALHEADLIVLGPGSLYTSILPNLLIPGIRQAIEASRAPVALVLNLMTQPGETDGMDGLAHLEAVERYAGEGLVDCVLANSTQLPAAALELYATSGSLPVAAEPAGFAARGVELRGVDLLAPGELLRHDPAKLARAVIELAAGRPGRQRAG